MKKKCDGIRDPEGPNLPCPGCPECRRKRKPQKLVYRWCNLCSRNIQDCYCHG